MVLFLRGPSFLLGCLLIVILAVLISPTLGQTPPTTCTPATRKARSSSRLTDFGGFLQESLPAVYKNLARRSIPSYEGVIAASGHGIQHQQTREALPIETLKVKMTELLGRVLKRSQ
ncbi:Zn-finger domain protein, putative [Anopheles sinensis]|uniref:Zn-finger domain protein, putative n=1 Tax=Anopheles sinensis TaxID=74873 RepID=A0A084VD72_ANOSI|nr:Zn-finger domain protein, putative [Anopheles sinensis]